MSRREFGKEIFGSRTLRNWKTWPRQKFILEESNAKELLISQRGEEVLVPIADGTAKLSGGDCEFRELTLRREQTVGSEDLSGELQGESEGP